MKKTLFLFISVFSFINLCLGQTICGAGAITLTPGTAQCGTSTTGGSFPDNASAPTNPCDAFYNDGEYWFKYTGTGNVLNLTLSSITATYAGLFVYNNCPSSSPTCVASAVNGSSTANITLSTPTLTTGVVYYIAVVNWGTPNTTSFCLNSTVTTPPVSGCASATTLACGTTNLAGTTVGTTAVVNGTGCTLSNNGQWYTFTGDGQQTTISSTGTGGFDQEMAVMSGTCASLTNISCNDVGGSNGSESYTLNTVSGTEYFVYMAHYAAGTTTGTYTISRSCAAIPVSGCGSAAALTCGTSNLAGTTVGTTAVANGTGCTLSNNGQWYTFVGDGQQTTISSTGTGGFDQEMAVMSGTCASLTNISCNDAGGSNGTESYTFTAVNGTTYFVYMAHYASGTTTGTYTISRSCGTPVSGCTSATNLPCGTSSLAGTTVGVTSAVNGTGCTLSNYGAWYTFAGNDQQTTINVLSGGSFDAEIAIASGSCALLTNISCTDAQLSGANENVSFFANLGTTYYVYVAYYGAGGTAANTGPFTITRNCGSVVTPVGNQDCSSSIQICSDQSFGGNSDGDGNADLNAGNEGCATENQSSWYFFSPVTTGILNFTIQTTVDYDFAIWGPFDTKTCPIATAPIRCSFAAEYGITGLSGSASDASEDASGDRWVAPLSIPASALNKYYIMLIDNFWATSDPFTIDFNMANGLTLNCTPLPVDLVNFLGYTKENENHLVWMTASERNSDYFIVEKSADGLNWNEFERVGGEGNSNTQKSYAVLDKNYQPIENYYRLSQVDFDGERTTFNTIVIDNKQTHVELVSTTNTLGQKVDANYRGLVLEIYSDGSVVKKIK